MANGDLSIINNCNNTDNLSHTDRDPDIRLHLQYNDQQKAINKHLKKVQCSLSATIRQVIQELLKCIDQENVLPEDVYLINITHDIRTYALPVETSNMTLKELKIVDGCTLYFVTSAPLMIEEPFTLAIWPPIGSNRVEYKWYKKTTTLGTLLEHVIQTFSLDSIERERIHLFYKSDELDLVTNYDTLLSELGIDRSAYIDVNIIPPEPYIRPMHNNTPNGFISSLNEQNTTSDRLHTGIDSSILLTLKYTDQFQDINKTETHGFLSTTTILDVTKQFLKFVHLEYLHPEDVTLVEYGRDTHYKMCPDQLHKTLKQLSITDGYTLYFEPVSTSQSTKLYTLTVTTKDTHKSAKYEWDRTTTFDMLLDYVIKEFALQLIERERIRFIIHSDKEIDHKLYSNRLLSDLGITNNSWIQVKIIHSDLSLSANQCFNVRVECTSRSGVRTLDVPHTITIKELKNQIEKQYNYRDIIDLKLFDHMNYSLNIIDQTQTLSDLGVVPGETVDARVTLTVENPLDKLNIDNDRSKRTSSVIANHEPDEVIVKCTFSTFESNTIKASVNDTVAELIRKVESLVKNRPLAKLEMWCESNEIDTEQPNRHLSDFGIKTGDIINVNIKNESSRKYTLEQSTNHFTSYKLDTTSTSHRISLSPIGLSNIGNTCYMNSALQCLAHAKPLTQFFLDILTQDVSGEDKSIDNDWNHFYTFGSVTGAYADLLKNLWLPAKSWYYSSSFRPSHLKETIGLQAPRFATCDQQDAQEFMTCLLDEIHKELKDKKEDNESTTIIEDLFFGKLQSTITCCACQHQVTTINPISFLPLPLNQRGYIFSIKFITRNGEHDLAIVNVPENGHVKDIIEAYAESRPSEFFSREITVMTDDGPLPLETPLGQLIVRDVLLIEQDNFLTGLLSYGRRNEFSKSLTLEQCLLEFFSIENLEDSWLCQQEICQKHTQATKQLQLCTLPPILIIQLKRFSQQNDSRYKIETFVNYPMYELDLSNFLSSSEEAMYDLFAVCNHTGSIYGGHYIAYVKYEANGINKWYRCDDTLVWSAYQESDVISKDAYLLFYIKRDKPKQSTAVTTS